MNTECRNENAKQKEHKWNKKKTTTTKKLFSSKLFVFRIHQAIRERRNAT